MHDICVLADLQADLRAFPCAIEVIKSFWFSSLPAVGSSAAAAINKISGNPVTFDPSMVDPWKIPDTSISLEDIPLAWCFWICNELDEIFCDWFNERKLKKPDDSSKIIEMIKKSPRVQAGLSKVLDKICEEEKEVIKACGALITKIKNKESNFSTATQDPGDIEIPPFVLKRNHNDETKKELILGLPCMLWTLNTNIEPSQPDEPAHEGANSPTRREVSEKLTELLLVMPPIPRIWADHRNIWELLNLLCTSPESSAALAALRTVWSRDFRLDPPSFYLPSGEPVDLDSFTHTKRISIPIPEIPNIESPCTSWLRPLQIFASYIVPPICFSLRFFKSLLPQPPPEPKPDLRDLNRNLLCAVFSSWPVLSCAVNSCGFICPSYDHLKSDWESQTQQKESSQQFLAIKDDIIEHFLPIHPTEVHRAWDTWGRCLSSCCYGADQWVPCVVCVVSWLCWVLPGLSSCLWWSADLSSAKGVSIMSSPDGMWCSFRGLSLRLSTLPFLPSESSTQEINK